MTNMPDSRHVHESYPAFIRAVVMPMHLAAPDDVQLDGRAAGGNRDVAGRFRFRSEVWRVHMDSRYEPLLLAYYAWVYLKGEDTLVEAVAEREGGRRLDIHPDVRSINAVGPRYLYIYPDRQ